MKFKLGKKLSSSKIIFQTRFFKNHLQINVVCFLLFRIEIAIKEASSPLVRDEMLDEAKAMVRVSKHDHIVNIQGNRAQPDWAYEFLDRTGLDTQIGRTGPA